MQLTKRQEQVLWAVKHNNQSELLDIALDHHNRKAIQKLTHMGLVIVDGWSKGCGSPLCIGPYTKVKVA